MMNDPAYIWQNASNAKGEYENEKNCKNLMAAAMVICMTGGLTGCNAVSASNADEQTSAARDALVLTQMDIKGERMSDSAYLYTITNTSNYSLKK